MMSSKIKHRGKINLQGVEGDHVKRAELKVLLINTAAVLVFTSSHSMNVVFCGQEELRALRRLLGIYRRYSDDSCSFISRA